MMMTMIHQLRVMVIAEGAQLERMLNLDQQYAFLVRLGPPTLTMIHLLLAKGAEPAHTPPRESHHAPRVRVEPPMRTLTLRRSAVFARLGRSVKQSRPRAQHAAVVQCNRLLARPPALLALSAYSTTAPKNAPPAPTARSNRRHPKRRAKCAVLDSSMMGPRSALSARQAKHSHSLDRLVATRSSALRTRLAATFSLGACATPASLASSLPRNRVRSTTVPASSALLVGQTRTVHRQHRVFSVGRATLRVQVRQRALLALGEP